MFTLNCNGRVLTASQPLVMGIINATPDSFYSGSRQQTVDDMLRHAERMLEEGAAILDIGGQSSRPGSIPVGAEQECRRVLPGIEAILRRFPEAFVSVDTYYAKVARDAVNSGACLVNDISAGRLDADLIPTVASLGVPYVLMHMQGTPQTMQAAPHYANVVRDVLDFFIQELPRLKAAGIHDIIMDPGFGFGKTIAHNFELLRQLAVFSMLERPVMTGLSRKSTIYRSLGVSAEQALNGSTVLHTIALMNGAGILRVHDVKEAREAVILVELMRGKG